MSGPDIAAWLELIGRVGWRKATPEAMAKDRPWDPGNGDRFDALAAFQELVAAEAAKGAIGGSTRERLFDGLMQGFDCLQAHRAAVLSIWNSRDPGVALLVAGRAGLHLRRLALAAGMRVSGIRGQLRLAALSALSLRLFAVWRRDESADMSATMAELDRLLDKAERAETEGLSPDLIGLPGLSAIGSRLGELLPFSGHRGAAGGSGDRVPPPSPDPQGE